MDIELSVYINVISEYLLLFGCHGHTLTVDDTLIKCNDINGILFIKYNDIKWYFIIRLIPPLEGISVYHTDTQ